jgi:hypothetical protein
MTSARGESPRLKSPTRTADHPRPATPAPAATAGGAPKVAAEGVLSALGLEPHPVTVAGILPGLQVRTASIVVADWLCRCGHHERARGKTAVAALTARVRVGECPHAAAPTTEGRQAA